jgi:hypothetical protein
MRVARPLLHTAVLGTVILALISFGCSKSGSGSDFGLDPKGEGVHISAAGHHVVAYLIQNKGKVPKNTGDVKDWAAKNNIPEDALISTRDQQPYEVHEVAQGPMKVLLLTETTGVKGKKYMWRQRPGGPAPSGSEATQEEIDSALQSKGGGRRGRPN